MARAFADITFTASVKAAQTRYGSRENNMGFELAEDPRNLLGDAEVSFLAERDSFYQATVSENGWPYVQHRGGPAGFLQVLDARTLGYADFSGNRQYISVGNINACERVSLIFIDYPNRRRLKIWGTASIVHENDAPDIIAALAFTNYSARVERAVIIHVEAIEWNCPKHITPRFTEADIKKLVAPLLTENEKLVVENTRLQGAQAPSLEVTTVLGDGILPLVISGIRQLTPRIRAYELRDPEGNDLPLMTAGAHLQIPVLMQDKTLALRQYSICSNPARRDVYEIAVLREDTGRGGSIALHDFFYLGLQLNCEPPKNHFHLHSDASPAILIAGGIGITPIKPMAQTLSARGRRLQLHYAGRSLKEMAFSDRLQREYGGNFFAYPANEHKRLDIMNLLGEAPHNAQFYVCGPRKLIDEVFNCATLLGIALDRIQSEQFTLAKTLTDKAVVIELARSNKIINVSADQPVLAALRDAGAKVNFDCCVGDCGACAVKVIAGEVEHRDHVLSDKDRAEGMMCICVSRAKTETLILDL